uniref:Uncharacterized protein n=1 Tax=Anguilla anguilla TaxID=7936 RepID=A0A0E9S5B3_ANGAN
MAQLSIELNKCVAESL